MQWLVIQTEKAETELIGTIKGCSRHSPGSVMIQCLDPILIGVTFLLQFYDIYTYRVMNMYMDFTHEA